MHSIGAIILAAGGSSRFGEPKQLLVWKGESLVRRAVRVASDAGCAPVVVVAGSALDQIALELRETAAIILENLHWQQGLGTSIHVGLRYLRNSAPEIEAVVLLACDQPFVDAGVITSLNGQRETSRKSIVASSYANTLGVPVLFEKTWFDSLLELPNDSGAKTLIESHPDDVAQVEFSKGVIDVDTPADLERLNL